MISRFVAALASFALLVAGAAASPAVAVQSEHEGVVAAIPGNNTPHVLDGDVLSIAEVGDVVVLGGRFTQARNFADGSPILERSNILAYDRLTGELLETFAPVVDDVVRAVVPAADGQSVFVGGQFGRIDGIPSYKIAKLDVRTGQPVQGFDPPIVSAAVMDLVLRGDRLFLAGHFQAIGSADRPHLAELDPMTGALRTGIQSVLSGTVWGGQTYAHKIDVSPDGSSMVILGNFRQVDGQSRVQVARLDLTQQPAALTTWSTSRFDIKCGSSTRTKFDVRDVDFSPDGSYFVIGATGGHTAPGALCDGVSRWESDAAGPSQEPTWVALTGGDSVYSVGTTASAVYMGGHFRWLNNPVYVQSYKGPGAVDREGIAALDPVNGLPLTWNPGRDRGMAVWDFLGTPTGLYVGSDTDRIARYLYRARIAFFPMDGGWVVPQPRAPELPVDIYLAGTAAAPDGLNVRWYDGDAADPGLDVAWANSGWNAVRGAFVADDDLYTAMSDGTLVARTFEDGQATGEVRTIGLNNLSAFSNEMKAMTGLTYDHGRMYFTVQGQNALYMRYFSVESDIVGATRTTVTGPLPGVDWRTVTSLFLAGGHMYWTDAAGNLHRIGWADDAAIEGTHELAGGPTVDGENWSASAAFAIPGATTPEAVLAAQCQGTLCEFDASASNVSGGEISSYQWDFGDGASDSGPVVQHNYATDGTFDVGLTVTADSGRAAVGTTTIAVANALPMASAAVDCAGLTCAADGSSSTDADGEIIAYSWDFGDGTVLNGQTAEHTYAVDGTYNVLLTVEDSRGATAVSEQTVEARSSSVEYVATEANVEQATASQRSLTLPAEVEAGDTMLLFWSSNSGDVTPTDPEGWTPVAEAATTRSNTFVWSRVAETNDAGSNVTVSTSTFARADLVVGVYRGTDLSAGEALAAAETERRNDHTTPTVTVDQPGSWLVSYWADKSSDTTTWQAPEGQSVRHVSAGSGPGHVSELLVDSGGPVPVGPAGGLVAIADGQQQHATMVSIVLAATGPSEAA